MKTGVERSSRKRKKPFRASVIVDGVLMQSSKRFMTAEEAAQSYDTVDRRVYGTNTLLNFPSRSNRGSIGEKRAADGASAKVRVYMYTYTREKNDYWISLSHG